MSGGLGNFFKKIIPIIMLVCFVSLGITKSFEALGIENLTYLSQETINVGTEENPQNFEYYNLDVNGYMQGMETNILERAVSNVFDVDTYSRVLNTFNQIWADGYQFFDGIFTLINAIILVIDSMIMPINALLVLCRVGCALILTGLTIVGININAGGVITTALFAIVDHLAIPLIPPVYNVDMNTTLNGREYKFLNSNLTLNSGIFSNNKYFYFESNGIEWSSMNDYSNKLVYGKYEQGNPNQIQLTVYENGQWINQAYREITILDKNTLTNNEVTDIQTFLNNNCIDSTLFNTTWQWTTLSFTTTIDVLKTFNFTSNNEQFTGIGAGLYNNDNQIAYTRQGQNSLLVYSNATWTNANYQYFTITSDNEFSQLDTQNLKNDLLNRFCTQV